jgi:hypothetical protein
LGLQYRNLLLGGQVPSNPLILRQLEMESFRLHFYNVQGEIMLKTFRSRAIEEVASSSRPAKSSVSVSNKRVREPIKNYHGLFRGKFPSRKMNRMVHWESLLERDAAMLFEFSPGVSSFREQPHTYFYTVNGRMRRYTPDFELTLTNGEVWLVEVKPAIRFRQPEEAARFARIAEYFGSQGINFRILTDETIRQPVLLSNLRMLCRYRESALTSHERRRLGDRIRLITNTEFSNVAAALGTESQVWRLIDQRIFDIDLRTVIESNTVLSVRFSEDGNEKLYF